MNIFKFSDLYNQILTPILAKDEGIDAEQLTNISLSLVERLSLLRNNILISNLLDNLGKELIREDQRLTQKIFGCEFKNPLGLAAGFDKNGVGAAIWDYFGFGFAELGTITWHEQSGNPKPRLFRLSKEKAALNRMGFNNRGATNILRLLKEQNIKRTNKRNLILGLNFGKSKITPINEAPEDYAKSLKLLAPYADYCVINISSPNTPGLRELQNKTKLCRLIAALRGIPNCPPLLIKISPDLQNEDIIELPHIALEEGIAGIIAINTSTKRYGLENRKLLKSGKTLSQEDGGLSGRPIKSRGLEVLKLLYQNSSKKLPLIAVGGIDSAETAWERIVAGASLFQIYTSWIYEGPKLVPEILNGLLNQLEKNNFNSISEAIGSGAQWKR